ncbi:MAG: alpha/beta hydrolase [Kangiellaceae bacterium]|nr:alpha/beta hydrolase [Kangiellaceae bacterium]
MTKSLVFLHGLGLGGWVFDEYYTSHYQALGYTVHNINLPGHNVHSTPLDRQRISIKNCVSYVKDYLLTHLHEPYAIAGMSMGGAICQKLLEEEFYPNGLRGVVLIAPVPPTSNLMFTLRLCRKLARDNPELLVDFFSDSTNAKLVFSPQSLAHMTSNDIERIMSRTLTGFSLLEYELFFQDLLKKDVVSRVPIKIIGGEDDQLFSPEVIKFTASYYSQEADILPGLGHMLPVESNYLQGINSVDSFLRVIF